MLVSLLIPASEGRQEQAGEPDADDTPRAVRVSKPSDNRGVNVLHFF